MTSNIETVESDEVSLLDLLQVVVDNLRLLVLGPLVAGLVALGVTFFIAPTFTATTKFMPPQQQSGAATMLAGLGALGGLAGAASGLKNPVDQYVTFLKSRTVQDALIDRFELSGRYKITFKEDARKKLDGNVQITVGKDGLITIDVSDKEPQFAAQLANGHVEELGNLLSRLAVTEAQQRRLFFEKQLTNAKNNLIKAEQILKSSGVSSSALKASPAASIEILAKLKAGITLQEIKVASMSGYFTKSAPDFKQAETELSAMRNQLTRSEKEEPTNIGDSDYITKYRDFKYHETLFELFAKQYEMARVDESREGTMLQVVDAAKPPERKSKPKKGFIVILVLFFASMFLLFFVFIRHSIGKSKIKHDSEKKLVLLRASFMRAVGRKSI